MRFTEVQGMAAATEGKPLNAGVLDCAQALYLASNQNPPAKD